MNTEGEKREVNGLRSGLIFVTGGARSGKSSYALKMAESMPGKKVYLATGVAFDMEMAERIELHRRERGERWITIEEPLHVCDFIERDKDGGVILLDCLTIWISNLIHDKLNSSNNGLEEIKQKVYKQACNLVSACRDSKANIIMVSNETGMGIVPDNPLSRYFRDISGIANQMMAGAAAEVYLLVSGLAMRIK